MKGKLKELKKKEKRMIQYDWIIKVIFLAFIITMFFSFLCETFLPKVNIYIGILLVIIFIVIGIIFDMIGVAITSADEAPFHSMASRNVKGGKEAIKMIKNASKLSSFCNDVIGDICGIISGTAGVSIALSISNSLNINYFIVCLLVTALIASLTIGGKAIGKSAAINKSNYIIYRFAKLYSFFNK